MFIEALPSMPELETSLLPVETELSESQLPQPSSKGTLKTPAKQFSFRATPEKTDPPKLIKQTQTVALKKGVIKAPPLSKPSPFSVARSTFKAPAQQPQKSTTTQTKSFQTVKNQTSLSKSESAAKPAALPAAKQTSTATPTQHSVTPQKAKPQERLNTAQSHSKKIESSKDKQTNLPLQSRQWVRQESEKWWEARYHQKEKERDGQKQDQEHSQDEESLFSISASSGLTKRTKKTSDSARRVNKPLLAPPKIGVFALYYILTKMGISSDGASDFAAKKEIEYVDEQSTTAHKKRLEEVKQAIQQEEENARWSIAAKAFSWIGSLIGIIAGVVLIATGVGVVAGAMLVVGGSLQVANQVMEITGGWQQIAKLLPGTDSEKKRAVLQWMQIGITVLCLIVSGVGVIWGGFASFGQATQTAIALFGGVASMGQGIASIGEGVTGSRYKTEMSEIKKYDLKLARLKHQRQDLMEKVEGGIDRLEQLFEDLSKALDFLVELFQADQMLYR
ncbi:MAG: hypothetical protein S4CHLAM123_10110 [Chlamydiales bacterium]|nr:hypothetical protein [Chlamydiales bacterium]